MEAMMDEKYYALQSKVRHAEFRMKHAAEIKHEQDMLKRQVDCQIRFLDLAECEQILGVKANLETLDNPYTGEVVESARHNGEPEVIRFTDGLLTALWL
jgi:hypothetical protein